MRRVAAQGEFRSNLHRGGRSEQVTLDPHYVKTAVRSAQILGLRIAGVDLLESADGPQVMEVNSSPGLEGIETVTQMDVAAAIIEYVTANVSFPDVDLRQRLTAWKGYGVGEMLVGKNTVLANRTIGDSQLREKDVVVLELKTAENTVVPNPKDARLLKPGDRLLCFGKLDAMARLTTQEKRRPRKLKKRHLPSVSHVDAEASSDPTNPPPEVDS
jgi:ribosomal protein S6--L-glutamate ligase